MTTETVIAENHQHTEASSFDWRSEVEGTQNQKSDQPKPQESSDKFYQIVRPKSNPWLKTALVGGAAFFAVLVFVIAFFTMNSITNSQVSQDDPALDVSQFKNDIDAAEPDKQDLQDQLTDKTLDDAVFKVNQKKSDDKPKPPTTPNSRTAPPPSANRIAAPRVIYRERPPSPRAQPASLPPAPKPAPKKVSRPTPKPAPKSSPKTNPEPQIIYRDRSIPAPVASVPSDPYQAWTQLTNLGSFAGGDITASASGSLYSAQDVLYVGSDNDVVPVFNPSTGNPYESEPPYDLFESEEPEPSINLPLGTIVKGKLMHDVSFVDGSTNVDKAVVELSEPLGDIPKGAMVSTQINAIDDSGALSMSILGYEVDNAFTTIDLPEVQVTSSAASTGKKGLGKLASTLLNIGGDMLQDQTGQSINFNGSGRISSVSTDSGNNFLDRALGATASEILGNNNRSSSRTSRKAPKVRKGSSVEFIVVEPLF